jgi:hypothetical protein
MEDWRKVLGEGVPGAVKLLTELDWKTVLEDLRTMKIAIIIRMIGGIVIHYLFIHLFIFVIHIALLSLFKSYLTIILAYSELYSVAIYLVPVPISIFLSRSDLKKILSEARVC